MHLVKLLRKYLFFLGYFKDIFRIIFLAVTGLIFETNLKHLWNNRCGQLSHVEHLKTIFDQFLYFEYSLSLFTGIKTCWNEFWLLRTLFGMLGDLVFVTFCTNRVILVVMHRVKVIHCMCPCTFGLIQTMDLHRMISHTQQFKTLTGFENVIDGVW